MFETTKQLPYLTHQSWKITYIPLLCNAQPHWAVPPPAPAAPPVVAPSADSAPVVLAQPVAEQLARHHLKVGIYS